MVTPCRSALPRALSSCCGDWSISVMLVGTTPALTMPCKGRRRRGRGLLMRCCSLWSCKVRAVARASSCSYACCQPAQQIPPACRSQCRHPRPRPAGLAWQWHKAAASAPETWGATGSTDRSALAAAASHRSTSHAPCPTYLEVGRVQLRGLQRILPHVAGPVARVDNVVCAGKRQETSQAVAHRWQQLGANPAGTQGQFLDSWSGPKNARIDRVARLGTHRRLGSGRRRTPWPRFYAAMFSHERARSEQVA